MRVLRPKRRIRLNIGRIVLLGISVGFVIWAIYPITYRIEKGRELEQLENQLRQIERRNEELQEDIKWLSSDEFVETQARILGFTRADEEIVVVIPERPRASLKKSGETADNDRNGNPPSLWGRIANIVSNIF